jgi:hypothetical protein
MQQLITDLFEAHGFLFLLKYDAIDGLFGKRKGKEANSAEGFDTIFSLVINGPHFQVVLVDSERLFDLP